MNAQSVKECLQRTSFSHVLINNDALLIGTMAGGSGILLVNMSINYETC